MTDRKKMGRPTDEPKPYKVSARLTEEGYKILDDYCQQKNINHPEGIRQAIYHLKNEK